MTNPTPAEIATMTLVTGDDARAALGALTKGARGRNPNRLLWAGVLSHVRGGGLAAIDADGYVRTWWPK